MPDIAKCANNKCKTTKKLTLKEFDKICKLIWGQGKTPKQLFGNKRKVKSKIGKFLQSY